MAIAATLVGQYALIGSPPVPTPYTGRTQPRQAMVTQTSAMQTWNDIHFSARDGLRLYARHYPATGSTRRPVLCLAGLTRNSRDFHDLATALAHPDDLGS